MHQYLGLMYFEEIAREMGDPGTLHYVIKVDFILWSVVSKDK